MFVQEFLRLAESAPQCAASAALQLPAATRGGHDPDQNPAACSRCSRTDEELLAALMEADDMRSRLDSQQQAAAADISQLSANLKLVQQQHEACQAELQQVKTAADASRKEADETSSRALCSASSFERLREEHELLKQELAAAKTEADEHASRDQASSSLLRRLQDDATAAKVQLAEAQQDAAEHCQHAKELHEQLSLAQLLADQQQHQKYQELQQSEQHEPLQRLQEALNASQAEVGQLQHQLSEVQAAAKASQAEAAAQLKQAQAELQVGWTSQALGYFGISGACFS